MSKIARARTVKGVFSADTNRGEALTAGAKTYKGHDCPNNHGGVRYTSNMGCVECLKQQCREFYVRHKDAQKERNRLHVKENQLANAVRTRNYISRKINAEGNHTKEDVTAMIARQKNKCYWCGAKVGGNYHVDHIIPLVLGGANGRGNICIACIPCNLSKGGKMPHVWAGRLL